MELLILFSLSFDLNNVADFFTEGDTQAFGHTTMSNLKSGWVFIFEMS